MSTPTEYLKSTLEATEKQLVAIATDAAGKQLASATDAAGKQVTDSLLAATGPTADGYNNALLGQAFTSAAKDPYSTVAASVGNVAVASQGTQLELAKGVVNIATDTAKEARGFAGEAARASTSDTAAHSVRNVGDVVSQAASTPTRAVAGILLAPVRGITYGVKSLIGDIRSTHDTRKLSERRTELLAKRNEVENRIFEATGNNKAALKETVGDINAALTEIENSIAKLGSGDESSCCGGEDVDVMDYIEGGNDNVKRLLCLDIAMMIVVVVFFISLVSVCRNGDCSWNKKLTYASGLMVIALGITRVVVSYFA